jgi:hypothetical protein
MDYTQSNGYVTDGGTGNRMHLQAQAVPTAVSDLDMNSLIWNAMEVVKAAGLAGAQFDKTIPATYQKLLTALRSAGVFNTPAQFDNTTKAATAAFVQRALGNLAGATQLGIGATTNLTAAQAGGLFQIQGGTVNLPASAGLVPGASYSLWSSGASNVVANGADKIYGPNAGVSSLALGANDFLTVTWQQSGVWVVTAGSSALGLTASFASTLAGNGYQKLPSGLIIQWGTVGITTATSVTFPITYPIGPYVILLNQGNNGAAGNATLDTQSWSTSGFTGSAFLAATGAATTRSAAWIAIGK